MKKMFLVVAVAFAMACGVETEEDARFATSVDAIKAVEGGTVLDPFATTQAINVDCTSGSGIVSIVGYLNSAGSSDSVDITFGGAVVEVIDPKDFLGKSIKTAPFSLEFSSLADGTYEVWFTQSGSNGREPKQTYFTFVVDCVL